MISSLGCKRGYKKTGRGQRKSSMWRSQGEAAWKGAFILAIASCENENISSFTDMDTCKWLPWTLHWRRAVKCLSCAHLAKRWELHPYFYSQGMLGWRLVTSCFSKWEKGGWLRVTVPLTHLLEQPAELKGWRMPEMGMASSRPMVNLICHLSPRGLALFSSRGALQSSLCWAIVTSHPCQLYRNKALLEWTVFIPHI